MKRILGLMYGLATVMMSIAAYGLTHDPLAAVGTLGLGTYVASATGVLELPAGVLGLNSLTKVTRAPQQKTNIAGLKRVYAVLCDDFTGDWPLEANVSVTTGECNVAPPLKTGTTLGEIEFSEKTAKADYAKEGEIGHESYKHMVELKLPGYEGVQFLALRKYLNVPVVIIVKHGDRKPVVYGSSDVGISLKESHSTGDSGAGRREFVVKGEQTGLEMAPVILASTVTLPLPV